MGRTKTDDYKKLLKPPVDERRWFRWAKRLILGLGIGGLTYLATIYQLAGGPPWPVEPAITPQAASAASPFDNPFDIANKSALADLLDFSIDCRMVYVKTARLRVTRDAKVNLVFPFRARGVTPTLAAGSTAQFTCPFHEQLEQVGFLGGRGLEEPEEARIQLIARYRLPYWWPPVWFTSAKKTAEFTFTLNTKTAPPRWEIPLF